MRVIRRYAVRGLSAAAAAAVGVGLLVPGVTATAADPVPGPEWGASQARPTFQESPSDGNPVGPGLAPPTTDGAAARGSVRDLAAAAAATPAWVLHGAGWGHGLGMSQYGAYEMAKAGKTAKQILSTYYTGTTYDAVDDSTWVNVNIATGPTSVSATSSALTSGGGPFTVTVDGATMTAPGPATVSFGIASNVVTATCTTCSPTRLSGASAVVNWDRSPYPGDRTLMKIAGGQYRDGVAIVTSKTASTLNVVMQVRVHDEYLDYIAESPWSWSQEALKAQAAAARGYVLSKRDAGLRSACDCHVYDTTADQVYGGYTTVVSNGNQPYWDNWKAAVRATGSASTGYVPRYAGKYIQAFYSSSSGGRTENNEDVWGGTPLPYLRGVADPWSLGSSNPNRAWRQVTGGGSMASVFGLSDVARLDLRDRTVNGGVRNATATSSSGVTRTVRGDQLRAIAASPGGAVKSTMIRHLTGRLAGTDRFASATAVASRVPTTATSVVVAGGDTTLSDASVAGPLAATVAGPLLLTQRDRLPAATVAELNRRGSTVKTAYLIGGAGVVSEAVATQLRGRGLAVVRIGGRDRYETSALVAKTIKSKRSTPTVVVAGGDGLADALGASGPASALKAADRAHAGLAAHARHGRGAQGDRSHPGTHRRWDRGRRQRRPDPAECCGRHADPAGRCQPLRVVGGRGSVLPRLHAHHVRGRPDLGCGYRPRRLPGGRHAATSHGADPAVPPHRGRRADAADHARPGDRDGGGRHRGADERCAVGGCQQLRPTAGEGAGPARVALRSGRW